VEKEFAQPWLRPQLDGRVTASAAEFARQRGWNRMRAGRRLAVWQKAGRIRCNAEEILVTTSVTPPATDATGVVTVIAEAMVARHSITPVKFATFIVAMALACVSAACSIHGFPQSLLVRSCPLSPWAPH
jgi:hypothetical protein